MSHFTINLLAVLFLIGAILGWVTWAALTRRRKTGPEATCGKCGYIVRGVTTFNCPECGSDLREVGIVKPNSAPVMAPLGVVASAIVVFLMFFLVLGMFYRASMPQPRRVSAQAQPVSKPVPATRP